jgi:nucleoid DNA-binding protein
MEEIAEALAEELGLTRTEAWRLVRAVCDRIATILSEEGEVRLGGFGTFAVRKRRARRGRNPRTGASLQIPEQVAVTFRPAADLRARLAGPPDTGDA